MKRNHFSCFCGAALAIVAFIALCLPLMAVAEPIQLDIADSGVRKVMVAVPSFSDATGNLNSPTGNALAQLLSRALEFHGFIQVIDPARYQSSRDVDWRALGADYVVLGSFVFKGNQMVIEGRLIDAMEGKTLPGMRYMGSINRQDEMTLRFADALIKEFAGEPGISRTSIAFVSDATGRKEVYLTDVLGRKTRQVTRHNHLCVSPRFSADGRQLAYSSYHRGNMNLYITDLDQTKVTRVVSRRKGMNLAPAMSPDGRTMVVTLSKDGSPDLYLMDVKGKILKRLTRQAGINVSPSYSPDGQSIAFVSDRSGKPQVYIMEMVSGRVQRLTFSGTENAEPSWSPLGNKIVYTGLYKGHYQIFTIPVNGGSPTQVSSGYGDFESPSWSPDGKQIAFARKRNSRQEVCAVFENGRGLRTLFQLNGNQSYPRWSPRPDAKK